MRIILINTILCLFIVLIGIAYSSSSSIDDDDFATGNIDWNYFDNHSPIHLLNGREYKSRFWKRVPYRKFWKRSSSASAMNNNGMADYQYSQVE